MQSSWRKQGSILMMDVAFFVFAVAIFCAVTSINFLPMFNESKQSLAQADVNQIGAAVVQYHYETKKYPTNLSDLTKAGTGTYKGFGPWLAELKKDPWGNDYKIISDENGFVVYTTQAGKASQSSATKVEDNVIGFHGM